MTINTLSILDPIQALSNERQQLWRIAHRDKFSPAWWKRHNRIEAIGKRLDRLWHMHRIELADSQTHEEIDFTTADHFYDYRVSLGMGTDGVWRIEDETSQRIRYVTVEEGLRENLDSHYMKPISRNPSTKSNVGARQRQRAARGMIQLN